MKYCAIGVSFENQCTWSIELSTFAVSTTDTKEIVKRVRDAASCSIDDLDEVLVVVGNNLLVGVRQLSRVKGDF